MNPFVLQMLARMQQQRYGSTASDFPDFAGYPRPPITPEPVPVAGVEDPMAAYPDFDEEAARKRASREGIGAFGLALLAGAGKGDYAGSIAEGLAAMQQARRLRYQDERQEFRQGAQERLARDTYERQNRLTDAQIRNYEDDNERARRALEAKTEAERAEIVKQQQVVAGLPPEQRARLAPLIGTENFYRDYWEATKPEEPDKPYRTQVGRSLIELGPDGKPKVLYTAPRDPESGGGGGERIPTTRQFADGTTRQWNPAARTWDILAKAGPTEEQLHDDIAAEVNRRFSAWQKTRMEGVGQPDWEKAKPGSRDIPIKKSPSEHMLAVKMDDGSTRIMTEEQYMRWRITNEATVAVRRRARAAQGMRDRLAPGVYHFDEEGNPIP